MISGEVGNVFVVTTDNRGISPEEWAGLAVDKIVSVSENAPLPIREQARAFKEDIKNILMFYFNRVARSERTTVAAVLRKHGQSDLADMIEDIR